MSSPAKKSFRSRVGTVVRRTSSTFTGGAIGGSSTRPSTPSVHSSDSASLKHLDVTPPPADAHSTPSPIAESPAREAEALASEPKRPRVSSNLAQVVSAAQMQAGLKSGSGPADKGSSGPAPESAPTPAPAPEQQQQSTTQPAAISHLGEGFTTEPEEIHEHHETPPLAEPEAEPVPAFQEHSAAGTMSPPAEELSVQEGAGSYFDLPVAKTIVPPSNTAQEQDEGQAMQSQGELSKEGSVKDIKSSETTPRGAPTPAPVQEAPAQVEPQPQSQPAAVLGLKDDAVPVPAVISNPWATGGNSAKASTVNLGLQQQPSQVSLDATKNIQGNGHSVAAYIPPPMGFGNRAPSYTYTGSKTSSVLQAPSEDPFADPPAPREGSIAPSTMPEPEHSESHPSFMPEPHRDPPPQVSYYDASPVPVSMPLPARSEVIASRSVHKMPSGFSIGDAGRSTRGQTEEYDPDNNERRPLLSRPGTPRREMPVPSYLQQQQPGTSASASTGVRRLTTTTASSQRPGDVSWPVSTPLLSTLGWIEYVLPDGAFYYVHPTLRVTTDIDLRVAQKLEAVTAYFDRKNGGEERVPPPGWELWLREGGRDGKGMTKGKGYGVNGSAKRELRPMRCWVDHKLKICSLREPQQNQALEALRIDEEDRLDVEYRYWSFMEAHPAHAGLPDSARGEAMDALTWSYTDRLFPSVRIVPPPFSQEECNELMGLFRTLGGDSGIQTLVYTRLVARILMRVAQWRQTYFRPDKPLPKDTLKHNLRHPDRRNPFRRTLLDFLISFLCLGIPYVFMNRSHHHRVDEESGLQGPGPMLVIGACACIVAAIILSASVTFISLPGMDSIARVAGFIAILCSTASMASAVIALLRYRADTVRTGGEGLVMLSRRSIVMSLPIVLLVYSIVAFVTGVVLYSFRGVMVTGIGSVMHEFEDYTRWSVVGTVAVLTGLLFLMAVLMRRW